MNTMSYKGYTARIEYDDEDGIFFGRISGIDDGVNFHGETVQELRVGLQRLEAFLMQRLVQGDDGVDDTAVQHLGVISAAEHKRNGGDAQGEQAHRPATVPQPT